MMTPEQRAAKVEERARLAKSLLANVTLDEILTEMEQQAYGEIRSSPPTPDGAAAREDAYQTLRFIDRLNTAIRSRIEEAEVVHHNQRRKRKD